MPRDANLVSLGREYRLQGGEDWYPHLKSHCSGVPYLLLVLELSPGFGLLAGWIPLGKQSSQEQGGLVVVFWASGSKLFHHWPTAGFEPCK